MRYDDNGKEINDFVLNQEPFNNSKILIAGNNLDVVHQESMLHGHCWILELLV